MQVQIIGNHNSTRDCGTWAALPVSCRPVSTDTRDLILHVRLDAALSFVSVFSFSFHFEDTVYVCV